MRQAPSQFATNGATVGYGPKRDGRKGNSPEWSNPTWRVQSLTLPASGDTLSLPSQPQVPVLPSASISCVPFNARRCPEDALLALGISIGILIAGWTYLALGPGALPVWAGIVAWGCFFAAGGKMAGLYKTIAANLSGVLWAYLALAGATRFGGGVPVLSAMVGIAALIMVLQAKISILSFIPGAFIGAATAVSVVVGAKGTFDSPWTKTVIALVAGAVLGYLSEMLAGAMTGASKQAT